MRACRSRRGRICSFGLALVLALVPLTPALCGVVCASHAAAATTTGEHHSCHSPSENDTSVRPVPHACGHQHDDAVGLQELIHVVNPPALTPAATMTTIVAIELQRYAPLPWHTAHRPAGSHSLAPPLRV